VPFVVVGLGELRSSAAIYNCHAELEKFSRRWVLSAFGSNQTLAEPLAMSALTSKADVAGIGRFRLLCADFVAEVCCRDRRSVIHRR
jgi:hypothetical protein